MLQNCETFYKPVQYAKDHKNIKLLQTAATNATTVPLSAYHLLRGLKVVSLDASYLHQYFELENTKYGNYSGSVT
jgi:hypothetical protein